MVKNRVTLTWHAVKHSDSGVAKKARATRLYVCSLIDSYPKYVAQVAYIYNYVYIAVSGVFEFFMDAIVFISSPFLLHYQAPPWPLVFL